jgi:hypothetical protein
VLIEQVDLLVELSPALREAVKHQPCRRRGVHGFDLWKPASPVDQVRQGELAELGAQRLGCRRNNGMKLICGLRSRLNRRASFETKDADHFDGAIL